VSYGARIADAMRRGGIYVGGILKARSSPTCRCRRRWSTSWSSPYGPFQS